jgi:hypothetical protein
MSSAASSIFGDTCPRSSDPWVHARSSTRPCLGRRLGRAPRETQQPHRLRPRASAVAKALDPTSETAQNKPEKLNHSKGRDYPSTVHRLPPTEDVGWVEPFARPNIDNDCACGRRVSRTRSTRSTTVSIVRRIVLSIVFFIVFRCSCAGGFSLALARPCIVIGGYFPL